MTDASNLPEPLTDSLKAQLVGIGNVFLLIIVVAVYGLQPEVSWTDFFIFAGGEAVVFIYCLILSAVATAPDNAKRLGRALSGGITVTLPEKRVRETRPWKAAVGSFFKGIWPMIVINFVALGYLIVRTGGPIHSAFGPVPIVMLALGQLLVEVPPLRVEFHWRGLWTLAAALFRNYWPSAVLGLAFYVTVLSLNTFYPDHLGSVPPVEYGLVTAVSFGISTLFALCTRAGTAAGSAENQGGSDSEL